MLILRPILIVIHQFFYLITKGIIWLHLFAKPSKGSTSKWSSGQMLEIFFIHHVDWNPCSTISQ